MTINYVLVLFILTNINSWQMDKRPILMDAATYIQNLLREIEEVKSEIAEQERCHDQSPASSESNLTSPDMSPPPHEEASSDHHHIFKVHRSPRSHTYFVVYNWL